VFAPEPSTLPRLFLDRVAATPEAEAFVFPDGRGWKSLTWTGTLERVRAVAGGLRALGLTDEACCAILASTRVEWLLADLGVLCAGGTTSTIYPSSTPDECAFIVSDSGAAFAFAENAEQVSKLAAKRAELPALRHVITFDGSPSGDGWVLTLAELEERGRRWEAERPGRFEELARAVRPESLATIIYTSGTTGSPRGVELTHGTWAFEGQSTAASEILPAGSKHYLWLPLAHVFGKVLEAAQLCIGFSTVVDGRVDKMVENLAEVRPTFVCAVPRVFEKVHNKIVLTAREGGPAKLAIFRWATSVGRRVSRLRQSGRRPGPWMALQRALADRLVFRRIRAIFGGRLQFFVSGSAPLSREISEFFDAVGVAILQGYGLTESSAGNFCNRPSTNRLGTVGQALPGVEAKIAEDGEILLRGPVVMRGYHQQPQATAEAMEGGWLHTGDIGFLDPDGFLTITDRKKDLIKTSGGKYVAPQELETRLKAICPFVSQVVVHGNQRNYITALVTLEADAIQKWAAANRLEAASVAELSGRPEVRALLQGHFDQLNATLPRFATVKRFAILPQDLTEAAGELTASQKVKRKVVEARYRSVLDELYEANLNT
jgi:long-chain acyl-CoA synthetase